MLIKDGYKDTECGLLPEEWEAFPLDRYVSEMRGGAPFSPSDFTKEGYLVLHKGNIQHGGKLIQKDAKYTSEDFFYKYKNNVVDNSFIVTTLRDLVPSGPTIGLMVCIPTDNKYVLAQGAYGFKLMDGMDTNFLIQYSNSKKYRRLMQSIAVGSTQIHIRTGAFLNITIPIPPLKEQQKIASILTSVDNKIEVVEQNIQKTKKLKKALIQKLLNEGIGNNKYKDSEIGKIPESWEVSSLGKICSLMAGGTPSTNVSEYWFPKDVPWLSSGEVNKKVVYDTNNMISRIGLDNSSAKLIPINSILIALAGQGKTRGTVAITELELSTNQSVAAILPNENICMYYLYYNLDSRYEELRLMSTGVGGRGGLNLSILKLVNLGIPPLEEQKKIATIFKTVDKKINVLKNKIKLFKELKESLMQKLLTGQIRIKV